MNTCEQLSLWNIPINSESLVLKEMTDLKEKQNNLRKGLFQRYDIMKKEIDSLKNELNDIKQCLEIQKTG